MNSSSSSRHKPQSLAVVELFQERARTVLTDQRLRLFVQTLPSALYGVFSVVFLGTCPRKKLYQMYVSSICQLLVGRQILKNRRSSRILCSHFRLESSFSLSLSLSCFSPFCCTAAAAAAALFERVSVRRPRPSIFLFAECFGFRVHDFDSQQNHVC
jgi:hypothetical protein